jgi:hypothetical protein
LIPESGLGREELEQRSKGRGDIGEFGNMGLDSEPLRIEDSSLGKEEAVIIRDPECVTVGQLIAENERLQLLIVELLMKNEHLRVSLQDKKST